MARRSASPSFITEIPLQTSLVEEKVLLSRLEAGRQLYNACLGEAMRRVRLMRQSKLPKKARKLPKDSKERTSLFKFVNQQYCYSEYALHSYAKHIRASWIGEHIDANTAQTLATRAFTASQKVLFGKARRVRFKGKNQLDSVEGKSNKQGIRWKNERVIWSQLEITPLITKNDPVILHGLNSKIKYVRLVRRKMNGKNRFYVQLVCEGFPYQKTINFSGNETIGLDLGPSTIAIVGKTQAKLTEFAPELDLNQKYSGAREKKPLSQRVHSCNCGVISQRDLYSAYLARFVDDNRLQADLAQKAWSGAELLLRTAWQQAIEQTNQQLDGRVPSSFGKIPPELELVVPKVIGTTESLDDVSISNDGESQIKVVNQFTNHASGGGCYEPPPCLERLIRSGRLQLLRPNLAIMVLDCRDSA
ncbi:MAG: hypothetical protein QNJ54_18490 [Prochloraceae cyanobacterium]|nr:hypothetical protein [Prochloraceae cyanobacterium]